MPDLNTLMTNVQKKGLDLQNQLQDLLIQYDELYRESNNRFMSERLSAGTMNGLEDFYHLVQIIRRNRDVVGSLSRGLRNIRAMNKFKFVEQDVPEAPKPKKEKKSRKKKVKEFVMPPEEIIEAASVEETIDG